MKNISEIIFPYLTVAGPSRKRKRNPDEWSVNVLKWAQDNGTSSATKNQLIPKRKMGLGCVVCRFKCFERISYSERKKIFQEFWEIGDHVRQWDCIDKSIATIEHDLKESDGQKHRSIARNFILTVHAKKIKVCQTMFLHTFGNYYLLFLKKNFVVDKFEGVAL